MPSRASARPPTIPVAGPTLGAAGSLLGGRSSAGEPHQGRAPLVAQGTSSACGIFTEIPSAGANGLQKEQWSIDCHAIDWLPVSKLLHCVSAHAVADFCHTRIFKQARLQLELETRGLQATGNKPALANRLHIALTAQQPVQVSVCHGAVAHAQTPGAHAQLTLSNLTAG